MRRAAHEVPLSELSEEHGVATNNEKLADALTALPDDKRDIVLLAYFLDMNDQEIASGQTTSPHNIHLGV